MPNPIRPMAAGRDAWCDAALDALAESGADNLHIESLARRMGVTKGSFYWHFADRTALLLAVLERWRDARITAIAAQIEAAEGDARARLGALFTLFLDRRNAHGLAVELAIRDWSRHDAAAAAVVAAVDAARLAHVTELFGASGRAPAEAAARALAFYAFLFGQSLIIVGTDDRDRRDLCASLLIG